MHRKHALHIGLAALVLTIITACGGAQPENASTELSEAAEATETGNTTTLALPDYFDCVREAGGVVLAAHRGGPAPGYPENAVETLQYGWDQGVKVFEIDVAESRDGMLFLMHDRTLGRTSTGSGAVADTDWEEIARARLIDNAGTMTDFHAPRLTDVLLWAVETGAVLELDRKPTTSFRNIVSAVRAAGAENNVLLITYNNTDVAQVAEHAPDMMLTASAHSAGDVAELDEMGIDPRNLVAWTGTSNPDTNAFDRLQSVGVEPAFGTLGRPGERLDDLWIADGDVSEFETLIEGGLVLLATDIPYDLLPLLEADDTASGACPR